MELEVRGLEGIPLKGISGLWARLVFVSIFWP
jgi:hypothetical protein